MDALAHTLRSPQSVGDALDVITAGAVRAIPGADHASISVRHQDGTLETLAPTDPLISDLDAHQYELHEGPCYDIVTGDSYDVTFDLEHDARWPRYGPIAAEAGMHGQLAVLLTNSSSQRSALNVYSAKPFYFDDESVETAGLFASHASVAMGCIDTVASLGLAIDTRQGIGKAIGILMERYQIDEARAFAFLTRTSQQANVKLRDVANEVVTNLTERVTPLNEN